MAQYTITITNCSPSNASLTVEDNDQVKFCSADNEYKLTGLGNIFSGVSGQVTVPAASGGVNGCTGWLTVNGSNGNHSYNIGPNCPPQGAPEIIIDEGTKKSKPAY